MGESEEKLEITKPYQKISHLLSHPAVLGSLALINYNCKHGQVSSVELPVGQLFCEYKQHV